MGTNAVEESDEVLAWKKKREERKRRLEQEESEKDEWSALLDDSNDNDNPNENDDEDGPKPWDDDYVPVLTLPHKLQRLFQFDFPYVDDLRITPF